MKNPATINNRGDILTENVIFIVLTLIFFTILIIFIFSRTGGAAIKEEELAKQTALIIDSAKPGMIIKMNVEEYLEIAKKENYDKDIITTQGNLVTAKFRENGGYSYSFFNSADVEVFPGLKDSDGEIKNYVITLK